jgi:iron complex transport system substrate-binding protein
MKRIIALLTAFLMIFVTFTGCVNKGTSSNNEKTNITTQTIDTSAQNVKLSADNGKEKDVFPLTVKDAKGTEMILEEKPEKIVSLTLGTDEMLVSLVDKSRIKGITYLSEDPGLSNIVDFAKDFPNKIHSELETIISIQPDIVFMADWADEKMVSQLRNAKIPVYICKTPNNIDEQRDMLMEISQIVGEEEKGEELVNWMNEKLQYVDEKVKTLTQEEKLIVLSLDSFFNTYGENTTFNDVAVRAGLINAGAETGQSGWYQIEKEKVIEINPDIIFLPSWSYEGFDANEFAEEFKKDKSLAGVKAVANGRVYMLNEALATSVSHNIVLGVEYVAKTAYPDLFK